MSAIPETKYRFTLAQGLEYQTEGTDHQNDFCEMDNQWNLYIEKM